MNPGVSPIDVYASLALFGAALTVSPWFLVGLGVLAILFIVAEV